MVSLKQMLGLNGNSHGPYIEIDELPKDPWLAYVVQIDSRNKGRGSYVPFRTLRNLIGRAFQIRSPVRAFEQREALLRKFRLSDYDVAVYAVESSLKVNPVPLFLTRRQTI